MQHRLYVSLVDSKPAALLRYAFRVWGCPQGLVGTTAAAAELLLVERKCGKLRASAHWSLSVSRARYSAHVDVICCCVLSLTSFLPSEAAIGPGTLRERA
jgi:hypothetical protein